MVYVQFGTQNDRFLKRIMSSTRDNSVEYSVTINTPQLKKYDHWIYSSDNPLEITHDFLALAMIELSKSNTATTRFSVEYHGNIYDFELCTN
ncbi:MAG: hypothetical protein JEZ08_13450 [Clostridiales bacterium]|nr:hypothetical protein [Clostridiales bacterium]